MFVFLHSTIVEDSLYFNSLDFDHLGNYNHIIQVIDENLRIHFLWHIFLGWGGYLCATPNDYTAIAIIPQTITELYPGIFCTHFLAK